MFWEKKIKSAGALDNSNSLFACLFDDRNKKLNAIAIYFTMP